MAVRTASQKVSATVEFITAVKTNEYGEYQSILFRRADLEGDEAKIWRSFPPTDAALFTKGQTVLLIPAERKGKQTWDVEILEPTATPAPAQPPAPTVQQASGEAIPESQKPAIAEYVVTMAKLLSFCRQQAAQAMPEAPEAAIQAASSTLFIACQRKFSL